MTRANNSSMPKQHVELLAKIACTCCQVNEPTSGASEYNSAWTRKGEVAVLIGWMSRILKRHDFLSSRALWNKILDKKSIAAQK